MRELNKREKKVKKACTGKTQQKELWESVTKDEKKRETKKNETQGGEPLRANEMKKKKEERKRVEE